MAANLRTSRSFKRWCKTMRATFSRSRMDHRLKRLRLSTPNRTIICTQKLKDLTLKVTDTEPKVAIWNKDSSGSSAPTQAASTAPWPKKYTISLNQTTLGISLTKILIRWTRGACADWRNKKRGRSWTRLIQTWALRDKFTNDKIFMIW